MALPDDLSPDRDPRGEHPCRFCVHGYHLLVLLHGLRKASSGRRGPPTSSLQMSVYPDSGWLSTDGGRVGVSIMVVFGLAS
jgi:hypothetical protein